MNSSTIHRSTRKVSKDQMTIWLLFVIGLTGQMIVFMLPDPLQLLAPQVPMLMPQDWQGSYVGTKMFFTDNWQTSNSDPYRPFLWAEKRGFYQSLYLPPGVGNISIAQTVIWYANPDENADEWHRLANANSYNGWPIVERSLEADKPASLLACYPDTPPQCLYLASWDHWFTAVFFWREADEALLIQYIHQLTARIDQLLMSAPDEPCYGFLCTK
jgi:hypothetical protein